MSSQHKSKCYFCDSGESLQVREITISFGLGNNEYSFCSRCLRDRTAEEFWEGILGSRDFLSEPRSQSEREARAVAVGIELARSVLRRGINAMESAP